MTPPAATGWSTSKEVGQSVSEQFAHEGAPNGESTQSDVVDPAVETDDLSASDVVASGAEDTAADADETVTGETNADEAVPPPVPVDGVAGHQRDEPGGGEPASQGSGDPV